MNSTALRLINIEDDNINGDTAEGLQPKKAKPSFFARVEAMVQDKQKVVWAGLSLTVVIQAIVLSAWVGSVAERVDGNTKKIESIVQEQRAQGALVYGLPYMQQSVTEIKSDVKELKQLVIQGITENQQKGRTP